MSKILIYFRELILPSTHKKKSDSLISDTTPEHSRKFTVTTKSETFRSPNFIRASPHINTIVTFESTTTCVSSLNITLFQSLFKVHLSFDLHQCTRRCLFSVRMARVLRIFLLVNSWNRNRLRTVFVEIVFGKTLWIHFVRNFRQTVSSVRFHTTQNLSVTAVIIGRPLRRSFSQLSRWLNRFKNFDTPDWLTPNISAIRRWFTPSSNK